MYSVVNCTPDTIGILPINIEKGEYDVMLLCLYKCTRGFILVQSFCKDIQICVYSAMVDNKYPVNVVYKLNKLS